MAKSSFDPSRLEPKNGDFAKYVDELNSKHIGELRALQVEEAKEASAIHQAMKDDLPFNQMNPHPVMPVPSPTRVSKRTAKQVIPVWIFFAFMTIFIGIFLENEDLILGGFFLAFVTIFVGGFISSISNKRK